MTPAVETVPRIVVFTGKGGVGKTTSAAAVAVASARRGRRTLVLSTDAAHSLADTLDVAAGPEPAQVSDHLWVQLVDTQRRMEQSAAQLRSTLRALLDGAGVDPLAAEEITVLPGADEVLVLLELRAQAASGRWDVVVVDAAPTAETLRLLALPEALGWYAERLSPLEERVTRMAVPALARATGLGPIGPGVLDAVRALCRDLAEVRALLTGPSGSVRLVLTPERVVVAESRRALTTLSLFGYAVDGVVANRVFGEDGADGWRAGWARAQRGVLDEVIASFAPLSVWQTGFAAAEPVGMDALAAVAEDTYGRDDPLARATGEPALQVQRHEDHVDVALALPFAARGDVSVARHGDELIVTVGSWRRLIALPALLGRYDVARARIADGRVVVRFAARERSEVARDTDVAPRSQPVRPPGRAGTRAPSR
ncbi:arsenite-transporting ATPase [Mumia flava]|uniref:Arsenite-transporting ATPase n=1 Tax=Mumia flava TaxID=1348852 RepID=A0A2M9BDP4_9ACTN|nr:ArsA family ATPase [Mumia flava]PJJ56059.1 arsenite-transporting ATPase [Mumia flava]